MLLSKSFNLEKINLLITVFSISLLFLFSCDKEIYDDAINQSQQLKNLSISKISFKELKSNKKAVEKIKSVITKKLPSSISQRAVYNDDFGVYIDTTNIVKMVSTTEESLTFNIIDYTDSTKKENLILISKEDGSVEAYIAEYNLTQQDIDVLASGGTLENLQPTSISEIESTSKVAVSGACVSDYTYSYWACYNSNGDIIANNGELGNGCVGTGFEYEMQVITIDMACLADGGGGGTTGSTGSTTGTGTTGSGPTGGSTNTGSNVDNGTTINTTFVGCTSCLEFSETLNNFLEGLTPEQLDYWNDLSAYPRIQQTIVDYLEVNSSSTQSIVFVINVIEDLNNDECGILPTIFEPSNITAPYNPNLLGDYPAPSVQYDHDAIQQQFNIIRSTQGDLAAVNYLINIYNMNTFGTSASITFNYSVSVANGLPNGDHGRAIIGYNSLGNLYSCELKIDTNLLSFNDFGYITRVIKHELLHVLQAQFYGQHNLHESTREFDAYFNQIFTFHDLKQIQDLSISCGLAKYMITYMNQMPEVNKNERLDMIKRVNDTFPKVCPEW